MVRLPMRVTKGRLSPLESADPHFPPVTPLECTDPKSPRFKSFIMNRSKKPGGGGGSRPRDRSHFQPTYRFRRPDVFAPPLCSQRLPVRQAGLCGKSFFFLGTHARIE